MGGAEGESGIQPNVGGEGRRVSDVPLHHLVGLSLVLSLPL